MLLKRPLALAFAALSAPILAADIYHVGSFYPVPGKADALGAHTVVVDKGKISQVAKGYRSADELGVSGKVHDYRDHFMMPGLIDMHVHITFERDENAPHGQWLSEYESDRVLRAVPYAKRTLHAGFTTVRDLGSDYRLVFPLKYAIARGDIKGPRILAAGNTVTPTGGHADMHGYRMEITDTFGPSIGVCDGADDCTKAVRRVIKSGADVIKITATGGVLSNTAAGVSQQFTDEELAAIVDTAHKLGRKVTAHAHGVDGLNAALRAGVDSIEHGSYLDESSIALFKKTGAYYVPTLLAGATVAKEADTNPNMPKAVVAKVKQVAPQMNAAFKKAMNAGVNIAFGTDSGVSRHGTNQDEFALMVANGMPISEALKTATVNAAELLGMSQQLGTLEVGKSADFILLAQSPLEDVANLKTISSVAVKGQLTHVPKRHSAL